MRATDASRRVVAVAVVGALLTLTGCGMLSAQPQRQPACRVAADVTGSHDQEIVREIKDNLMRVLKACTGGRFSAALVTSNSQASACTPVRTSLQPEGLRGNKVYDQAKRQRLRRQVAKRVTALVRCGLEAGTPQGSDLFGSLVAAGRVLHGGQASRRMLVFFTDGLNTRDPFEITEALDRQSRAAFLRRLKEAGLLANLSKVDVYMVGAGVGAELTPQQLARLQQFWRAYFAEAGARLVSYGPTLPSDLSPSGTGST